MPVYEFSVPTPVSYTTTNYAYGKVTSKSTTNANVNVQLVYDNKSPSSGGRWPLLKGIANCTNSYSRRVTNGPLSVPIEYATRYDEDPYRYTIWAGSGYVNFGALKNLSIPSEVTQLISQAKLRLRKKYQNEVTLFQGGVFIAELRETVSMIRHPAKELRRAVGRFVQDQRRSRKQPIEVRQDILAKTYLEFVFGVQPFIGDINSALTTVKRLLEQQTVKRLSAKESSRFFLPMGQVSADVGSSSWFNRLVYQLYREVDLSVQTLGDFRVDNTGHVGKTLGVSLDTFVPTLWEILPWSFLIDYFTNIGDLLASTFGSYPDSNWTSQTVRMRVRTRGSLIEKPFGSITATQAIQQGPTMVVIDRQIPDLSVNWSDLSFEIPGFDTNPGKWLNIAALLSARAEFANPTINPRK